MKAIITFIAVVFVSANTYAADNDFRVDLHTENKKNSTPRQTEIRKANTYGQIDYSKGGYKKIGDTLHQTDSLGRVRYDKPRLKKVGNTVYETKNRKVDFSKPKFKVHE